MLLLAVKREFRRGACRLLEVMRKTDDADGNQIDRHDIIEQPRHEQDENTRDQCNEWADEKWIKGWHRFFPVDWAQGGPIRRLDERKHKRSRAACPRLKRQVEA